MYYDTIRGIIIFMNEPSETSHESNNAPCARENYDGGEPSQYENSRRE